MIKEIKVGTTYYMRIDVDENFLSSNNETFYMRFASNFKYRINGGSWNTITTAGFLRKNATTETKLYQAISTLLYTFTLDDVFEIVGTHISFTTNHYDYDTDVIKDLMNQTTIVTMQFDLYKLNCEQHLVNKTSGTNLTFVDYAFGSPREEMNLLAPSIIFEYHKVPDFNYIYISDFQRYYFVTNITSIRNNIYRIDLKVDVLCSFSTDLLLQDAFVTRNEDLFDDGLVDNRIPLKDIPDITFDTTIGASGGTSLVNVEWDYDSNVVSENIALCVINDLPYTRGSQVATKPSGTTLPTIMRRTGDNPLTMIYALTSFDYQHVASKIKNTASLAGYVAGVVYFPFKLSPDFMLDGSGNIDYEKVKINNTQIYDDETPPQELKTPVLKGESSCYYIIADFNIQPQDYNELEFMNYEPYIYYELYIPFKGWINLSVRDVYNSRIIVYYAVDYLTGDGSVYVYNYTNNKMVYSSPVQIGIKMGASVSNLEEITKQKQTNTANLLLGLIGAGTSTIIGIATENPVAVVSGVLSGTKAIASAVNVNRMLIEKADCTISGDKMGLYGGYVPVLKTIKFNIVDNYDSDIYPKLQGHQINAYLNLSTLSGYTEVTEMHYTPSSQLYITKTEIDEIVALAKNGIIL